MRAINIAGQRSGMLVAREPQRDETGVLKWLCDCDCGGTIAVVASAFVNKYNTNCGCARAHLASVMSDSKAIGEEYLAGATLDDLMSKYHCGEKTIRRLLKQVGAQIRDWNSERRMPRHKISEAVRLYKSGLGSVPIGRKLGFGASTIVAELKKSGVVIRERRICLKHSLNESAFDDVSQSPVGQYLVGLIMADGCVGVTKNGTHFLNLALSGDDGQHLYLLKDYLGTSSPVKVRDRSQQGWKSVSVISVRSRQICQSISQYGVSPRKSFTAKVLKLEDSPCFWCGAICGDGFLIFPKGCGPYLGLCGSQEMVEQFAAFVARHTGTMPNVMPAKHSPQCFSTRIYTSTAQRITSMLFEPCHFALPRKKLLAEQLIGYWSAHRPRASRIRCQGSMPPPTAAES